LFSYKQIPITTMIEDQPNTESVTLAYGLAVQSYDQMMKRADVWDSNIERALAWGTALNLAIISISITRLKPEFDPLFWSALGVIFCAIAVGLTGRYSGVLTLISPKIIYDEWLSQEPLDFKQYFVFYAGEHWDKNAKHVERKVRFTNWTSGLFIVASALLILWSAGV